MPIKKTKPRYMLFTRYMLKQHTCKLKIKGIKMINQANKMKTAVNITLSDNMKITTFIPKLAKSYKKAKII